MEGSLVGLNPLPVESDAVSRYIGVDSVKCELMVGHPAWVLEHAWWYGETISHMLELWGAEPLISSCHLISLSLKLTCLYWLWENPLSLSRRLGNFINTEVGQFLAVFCQTVHLLPRELLTQGKLPQNSMSVLEEVQLFVFIERVIRIGKMGNRIKSEILKAFKPLLVWYSIWLQPTAAESHCSEDLNLCIVCWSIFFFKA